MPGGRTPEEREAARKAREARRASRVDGKATPGRDWMAEARGLVADRKPAVPTVERPRLGARRAFAALAVLVAALLVIWFFASLFQPFKGDGSGNVRVVISKGAGVGDIGDELERRGVVSTRSSSRSAHFSGKDDDLKPGHLHAQGGNELRRRAGRARQGPAGEHRDADHPGGPVAPEVARLIGDQLDGSYLRASRRSDELNPRRYGAKRATNLEGFLFPATYTLKRGRPVGLLVDQQLTAFRRNFSRVNMRSPAAAT